MKAFVIDVGRCCDCYNCQLACKDEHVENDWTPYAKPQPETGQFWLKVEEHVCGTIPKVKMHYIPKLCNHCEKPACLDACPDKAISIRDDGLVLIEPERCTGCKACLSACPYGAVYFNDTLNLAQKCTGCAHLLDNGYEVPRCVESCPTDAMSFGEREDLMDLIEGSSLLKPEAGYGPRVSYRNIPGKFIAGTVYDPVEKEVIINARCLATSGGKVIETFTDPYGDFWFKDLSVGIYHVSIEAEGFKGRYFSGIDTAQDVNLGDIGLERK